jgi:hypothetical protein
MTMLSFTLLLLFAQSTAIQGIIVKENGAPLAKADIELRTDGADERLLNTATTQEDGGFVFPNLAAGRYRLVVTRSGYVRPPLTVTVGNGQPQSLLRLPMKATGAIYGRVVDDKGEAIGNVEVQALKATYPEGRRVLTLVRAVQTNDLGEYRLFWLPPGRYYIAAVHPLANDEFGRLPRVAGFVTILGTRGIFLSSSINPDNLVNDASLAGVFEDPPKTERYVTVFFPGVFEEQGATAIDVHSTEEVGGVNMVVAPIRLRRVRGVIVDGATGRPAQNASLSLADGEGRPRAAEPEVDPETGAFVVLLQPGSHAVTANAMSGAGYTVIQVGDSDIENLTIPTQFVFSVPGRISVDGGSISNSDLGRLQISLRRDPVPPRGRNSGSYSVPLPDASFNLDAGAGDFRVSVSPILNAGPSPFPASLSPPLRSAYVKSIRLGNADVLNAGLHLERRPETTLDIVLGTNPGTLDGVVLNDGRQPVGDVYVVLAPNLRRRSDLYITTTSDPQGRFRLEHIPPGDYKIFAWAEIENGSWFDPDFIRDREDQGTAIRIDEGSRQEIQIRVTP